MVNMALQGLAKVLRTVFLGHAPIFINLIHDIGNSKLAWVELANIVDFSKINDQVQSPCNWPKWVREGQTLDKGFLELPKPKWLGKFLLNYLPKNCP